jgi:hypothetical protein
MTRVPALRVVAVLLAAVVGVHELRYVIAFGSEASAVQAHTGHGYVSMVVPLLGVLMALALAQLVVRSARGAPTSAVAWRRAWPVAAAALMLLFSSQELLEGALSPGHAAGFSGVFGAGGWLALPLSVAFGALVALVLRVAATLERAVSRLRVVAVLDAVPARIAPKPVCLVRGRLLAERRASRAPPALSV